VNRDFDFLGEMMVEDEDVLMIWDLPNADSDLDLAPQYCLKPSTGRDCCEHLT
jgi:hypothetical protein